MRTAVVFVGGPHPPPEVSRAHPGLTGPPPDLVVAVDSGLHLARALGLGADLVVGDMDSVDPAVLQLAVSSGAEVQVHPADKDATDLELGLDELLARGVDRAVVVAADGGRMDHLLGSVLSVCSPAYSGIHLEAWLGRSRVVPVRGIEQVVGPVGSTVSILPVHGAAVVHTEGLRWALRGERLEPGTSRGLSNEMVDTVAVVRVDEGCVAVVRPEEEK